MKSLLSLTEPDGVDEEETEIYVLIVCLILVIYVMF